MITPQVQDWNVDVDGPITEAAIRLKYQPAWHYRISSSRTSRGESFGGSARSGFIYVLAGACRYDWSDEAVELQASQFVEAPAGDFRFTVLGNMPCEVVHVWLLPPAFRIRPP